MKKKWKNHFFVFMFNSDFYPTYEGLIADMVKDIDLVGKVVLEPSAGKGDIVDFLKEVGVKEVIACENNEDLKKILQTKCRVIADDFLTVKAEDVSHIHLIAMNPPFSADEHHINHAWDIAPDGCKIVALCNYETYRNPYSKYRKQLKSIIDQYGTIEYIGTAFKDEDVQRGTNAKVGLIRLTKPGESKESEYDGFFLDEDPEEQQSNGIMSYNAVRDIVNRYVNALKQFDKQIEVGIQLSQLTKGVYKGKLGFTCTVDGVPKLREDFKKELQKDSWTWIFNKMNMEKYTTKGLMSDINKFVEQQQNIPFTMKNIYKMLEIVVGTHAGRMDRAIIEVFDKLTEHYHDNRFNVEGWKTNSHYLMGEKFILPYITKRHWLNGSMEVDSDGYGNGRLIEDLVKALCFITGKNYDKIISLERTIQYRYKLKDIHGELLAGYENFFKTIEEANKRKDALYKEGKFVEIVDQLCEWGEWFDWTFFECKGYKKGTMHFKFKDQNIWAMFNQHVARIKGYPLPEAVNKK